jgi:hypothetical protein
MHDSDASDVTSAAVEEPSPNTHQACEELESPSRNPEPFTLITVPPDNGPIEGLTEEIIAPDSNVNVNTDDVTAATLSTKRLNDTVPNECEGDTHVARVLDTYSAGDGSAPKRQVSSFSGDKPDPTIVTFAPPCVLLCSG